MNQKYTYFDDKKGIFFDFFCLCICIMNYCTAKGFVFKAMVQVIKIFDNYLGASEMKNKYFVSKFWLL